MADATATPQPTSHEVTIEDIGPALKRLSITVPSDAVKERIEESIGTLSQEAALPGFRRGKAPRRLLEKRFGDSVRDETRNRLIADAYAKAIEEHGIHPVGEPEPTQPPEELTIEPGKPLTFAVDVEVVPEFELPTLEGIEINKPELEISDEHVGDRIKRQQIRMGTSSKIDGDFQPQDQLLGQVTVHAEGKDEPLVEGDASVIVVPSADDGGRGPVIGLMIDGLAGMLEGKRVNDTITIETVGPEGHEREDIRGAKLTIAFRIINAERPEPASIEQLVETFGVESEDNLREQMRLALQHQRDQEQATAMRQQVYQYLQGAVELALPEKLTAAQAARAVESQRIELLDRGMPAEDVERQLAETRADSLTRAQERLKLFFIMQRLGTHFNVDVSEQEVNGRVAAMAIEHGHRPDQLRAELAKSGRLTEVARMVRDEKTADRVIATAKVAEIPAEKWNEMLAAETGKKGTPTARKAPRKTKKKAGAGAKKTGTKQK
jgi:trigger factor